MDHLIQQYSQYNQLKLSEISTRELLQSWEENVTSWLKAHPVQNEVETLLSDTVLKDKDLFDYMVWNISPLLLEMDWSSHSKVVDSFFDEIPAKEVPFAIGHLISPESAFDLNSKARCITRLFQCCISKVMEYPNPPPTIIEAVLKSILDSLPIRNSSIQTRFSTQSTHQYKSSMDESKQDGSKFQFETAEDTGVDSQKIPVADKQILFALLPSIISDVEYLCALDSFQLKVQQFLSISTKNDPNLASKISIATIVPTFQSFLFLLSKCVIQYLPISFDEYFSSSTIPVPPELKAPIRPSIPFDSDLIFLEACLIRIKDVLFTIGMPFSTILSIPLAINARRIHSTERNFSDSQTEDVDPIYAIELTVLGPNLENISLIGAAACVYAHIRQVTSVGFSSDPASTRFDLFGIWKPQYVLECLLNHSLTLSNSRSPHALFLISSFASIFSTTQAIASQESQSMTISPPPPSPIQLNTNFQVDIPANYTFEFVVEKEILPPGMPKLLYSIVRSIIDVSVRTPDTNTRQFSLIVIRMLVDLCNEQAIFLILSLLIKTCPYPSAAGTLVTIMKDSFLKYYQNLNIISNQMDIDGINSGMRAEEISKKSPFFNEQLFLQFFQVIGLPIAGMETKADLIVSSLNFLYLILAKDKDNRICAIWREDQSVKQEFISKVTQPLQFHVSQIIHKHMTESSSFEASRDVARQVRRSGIGNLSVDQIHESQEQTIIVWQLVDTLLQRVSRLLQYKPSAFKPSIEIQQQSDMV